MPRPLKKDVAREMDRKCQCNHRYDQHGFNQPECRVSKCPCPSFNQQRIQTEGMTLLKELYPHRLVKFPRSDGQGDGYWYRSEIVTTNFSSGSTYGTYEEADQDYLYTLEQARR